MIPGDSILKKASRATREAGRYRIGVTAARLTLNQEIVVQIHGSVFYSSVVKMAITPDCLSGDRGFESRRSCLNDPLV